MQKFEMYDAWNTQYYLGTNRQAMYDRYSQCLCQLTAIISINETLVRRNSLLNQLFQSNWNGFYELRSLSSNFVAFFIRNFENCKTSSLNFENSLKQMYFVPIKVFTPNCRYCFSAALISIIYFWQQTVLLYECCKYDIWCCRKSLSI